MLTRWSDFGFGDLERTFDVLGDLRRRMDRLFEDADTGYYPTLLGGDGARLRAGGWPAANLYDTGDTFVVQALVPGVDEKDLEINLTHDSLTITGDRRIEEPEGYSVHRRERGAIRFSRSYTMPSKVDPEKTTATLKNGLLTVSVFKAPESKPRKIAVKAS